LNISTILIACARRKIKTSGLSFSNTTIKSQQEDFHLSDECKSPGKEVFAFNIEQIAVDLASVQ